MIAAIDLGVDTLAAVTSNKQGFVPQLINGRPLKHLNAYYNKQRAKHQSTLATESRRTSRQLDRITTKRNRRINAYLHTASRRLIDQEVARGHRDAGDWLEQAVEARDQHRASQQPDVLPHSAQSVYPDA
jgi:transposase